MTSFLFKNMGNISKTFLYVTNSIGKIIFVNYRFDLQIGLVKFIFDKRQSVNEHLEKNHPFTLITFQNIRAK